MDIQGQIEIENACIYNFITNGQQVTVSASVGGSLVGTATLSSSNKSVNLYTGSGPGSFEAAASLSIATSSKIATLKYTITFYGQQGTATVDGTLGSWTFS